MKGAILLAMAVLLTINLSLAADLSVEKLEQKNILITEIGNNATAVLKITNNENQKDSFQIYSLVGVNIYPKGFFEIGSGNTISLEVNFVPYLGVIKDHKGEEYIFEYQIKGQKTGYFKDNFAIKILGVKDAVQVMVDSIGLNAQEAKITIKNKEDFAFQNLKIGGKSRFFEFSKTLDLAPDEIVGFNVPVTIGRGLEAGEYDFDLSYELNGVKSDSLGIVKYLEFGGISVSEHSEGFIVRKNTITKVNEGNIPTKAVIGIKKNVLTRLFTVYSTTADSAERNGLFVNYLWERELGVGESFAISSTTNYTFPFILVLIVILVAVATRFLVSGKLTVHKNVSLVKTRGGELALKVFVRVKARKAASNIHLTDRIPHMAHLYEKFGMNAPKVDHASRKLEWHINNLSSGEERVFTYIIYSKINVVGRFELPSAHASYETDGKTESVLSNQVYFAAETAER